MSESQLRNLSMHQNKPGIGTIFHNFDDENVPNSSSGGLVVDTTYVRTFKGVFIDLNIVHD